MWRLLIFELVIVAVVIGVWLLAPLVGITSVFWRVVIILALIVPPIALVLWQFFSARKASKGLEDAMKEQGKDQQKTVRPDRRGEIQELNENFGLAIASLKKSRLGGRASTALYALPWYMIIGPPAAGKTTALLRSGLNFPFTSGDKKKIKGVGGTRNCDWWFSDQAILLDTAGRYTSEDDDQEEWIAFLRMLKKYRKKRPLNGLIVAVSIAELVTAKPDEVEALAEKVRSRVDQVLTELRLALPVYVLFTKCDLLSGFVQFFGDMKKSSRSQVLGFTVPLTTPKTDVEKLFGKEFDLLAKRLSDRSIYRLATAKSHQRGDVYRFPLQLTAARDMLGKFVSQLMVHNPYLESPRLRGVYFCSGTQEGLPVDTVMGMMGRALGLREQVADKLQKKSAKKSYFLRDVFTEVMFPDKDLAGTSASGQTRRRRLGIAALSVSFLASAGVVGLGATTFTNNRELVTSSTEVAKNSRLTTPDDPRKVLDSLRALNQLGNHLDTLDKHAEEGPPWSMTLGFYKGDDLQKPVEQIYIKRMWQAFVMQSGDELEATLTDIANAADTMTASTGASRDFDLLKTYLMVTDPERLEVAFATNVLLGQWKKRLHPDLFQEEALLKRNVTRFVQLIKSKRAKWIERDKQLVRNVRNALRARDAEYQRLIGKANKMFRPFTLRDAMRGRVQSILSAKHQVTGAYTKPAWTEYMRKRIAQQMVKSSKIEPWVLGEEETKAVAERLRNRYFDQYIYAHRGGLQHPAGGERGRGVLGLGQRGRSTGQGKDGTDDPSGQAIRVGQSCREGIGREDDDPCGPSLPALQGSGGSAARDRRPAAGLRTSTVPESALHGA
jgi:type VI secretion system protein ImpL